jgi:hypothetical protein
MPQHREDAVDIAKQERRRAAELVLADAELGCDVLPREKVGLVTGLESLTSSPNPSKLLRGEPGRFWHCGCFARIGSLAPRKRPN